MAIFLTQEQVQERIQTAAANIKELREKAFRLTESFINGPVSSNEVVFNATVNLPYQWDPASESWHMLVKPILGSPGNKLIAFQNGSTNQGGSADATFLEKPEVNYLEWQYIYSGSDTMSISTAIPNVFIRGGSGTDAIEVKTGRNVLDGGGGSNWLIGGDGQDTFFTDARSAEATWSTIGGYGAGDAATIWGFVAGAGRFWWEADAGAEGRKGATLRIDVDSSGTIDASVTFAGLSMAQADKLQISTGTQPAGAYLHLSNPGT